MPDDQKKTIDPNASTIQGASGTDGGDPANTQQQIVLPADLLNQFNRMLTERFKREEKKQAEMTTKLVSDIVSQTLGGIQDKAGQPSDPKGTDPGAGSPAGDVEAKVRRELQAQYEKRISAMEKTVADERKLREQLEAERKQEELLRQLRSEAIAQGVREEMLDALEGVTYFSPRKLLRRSEDGKPIFMAKGDFGDDFVELSINDGLKKFLKTSEGLCYLKPDLRPGAGLSPRKPGTGNNAGLKTTGLRPAKTPEEAEQILGQFFSGTLNQT